MEQSGLFGLSDHLKRLSANGDPLEELGQIVDFKGFRPTLEGALLIRTGPKVADRPVMLWRCSRC
jgi:IS5 family transposase